MYLAASTAKMYYIGGRRQNPRSVTTFCWNCMKVHSVTFFLLISSSLASEMQWRSTEKVLWRRSCQMTPQSIGTRFTIIYNSRKHQNYLPADSWNLWSVTALRFLLSFISQCPARKNGLARTPSKIRSYCLFLFFFFLLKRWKRKNIISCLYLELGDIYVVLYGLDPWLK